MVGDLFPGANNFFEIFYDTLGNFEVFLKIEVFKQTDILLQ